MTNLYRLTVVIFLALIIAFFNMHLKNLVTLNNIKAKEDIYYCSSNKDCVPKDCCHSSECVNIKYKPNCKGIVCTMECRTILDCGMGYCACVNNKCIAIPLK